MPSALSPRPDPYGVFLDFSCKGSTRIRLRNLQQPSSEAVVFRIELVLVAKNILEDPVDGCLHLAVVT
jgi:hypothetical protein